MTTSTLPFVSENAVLSSLAAFIARFTSAPAAGEQSLMGLYRLAGSGDSVSPKVADALSRLAAQ